MKKTEKLYYILSYLLFIFPPFIWGFVIIFQQSDSLGEEFSTLIINGIVILLLALIILLLINLKRLHVPSILEWKYLIFGLCGNILVYLYTFQNILKIQNIITIYFILLIVLALHYFLISRVIKAKELWILLPLFLTIDYLRLAVTKCSYNEGYSCSIDGSIATSVIVFNTIAFLSILIYYVYEIIRYKQFNLFKIINLVIVSILSIRFLFNINTFDNKLMSSLFILLPFFIIIDFIYSIVSKVYTHKTFLFYIRTVTLFVISIVLGYYEFIEGSTDVGILSIMVIATYVSLFIAIFSSTKKINLQEDKDKKLVTKICEAQDLATLNATFNETFVIDERHNHFIGYFENQLVAFLTFEVHFLRIGNEQVLECKISNISMIKTDQNLPFKFLSHFEEVLKQKHVTQLSCIWTDLLSNIQMLQNYHYLIVKVNEEFFNIMKKI